MRNSYSYRNPSKILEGDISFKRDFSETPQRILSEKIFDFEHSYQNVSHDFMIGFERTKRGN